MRTLVLKADLQDKNLIYANGFSPCFPVQPVISQFY